MELAGLGSRLSRSERSRLLFNDRSPPRSRMPQYLCAVGDLVVDAHKIVAQLLNRVGGSARLHSLGVVRDE